jgi:predicted dehydrogenase
MVDTTTVRWGIAATGGIAAQMTRALRTLPDAEVAAVGSRTQESADAFAGEHGIPRAHGSYADLYADDRVDVVYVASPHSGHHSMTIDALRAGRHVLCEKAFAVNTAQAAEMIATARSEGRFLMEAMWSWFMPAWVEMRRRIDAGEIGDVRLVDATFGIPVFDENSRLRRLDLTGGALLDLGIYPLALARWVLGEPSTVAAAADLTDQGVDAISTALLTFPTGALGVATSTCEGLSNHEGRILGTGGSITVDAPFWRPDGFTIHRAGGEPEHIHLPNRGLAHEAAHCMERIRGGQTESDVMPWATTLANMELMDEIRRQIGVVYPEER